MNIPDNFSKNWPYNHSMNKLPIDQASLGERITAGIANRPPHVSPEQAAKAMLPTMSPDEVAVMVAIGADTLAGRSKILPNPGGNMRHG